MSEHSLRRMFCSTVCVFVILCNYVSAVKSSTLSRDSLPKIHAKYHSIENDRLNKILSHLKNEETRTQMRTVRQAAAAIVDDDFDIPSNINNNHENSSEIIELYENGGSGTDEFTEEVDKITIQENITQYIERKNGTTVSAQPTTNGMRTATTPDQNKEISLTDEESSGDDILLFTKELTTEFTKELTTEIHVTRIPGDTAEEIIPDICLNSTCSESELSLTVSDNHKSIAEGMNFTLSCKSNSSNHMLYWYKSNGSVYFLQQFGTTEELYLNFPETKPIHSGKYICVRWVDKKNCCNLESYLSVYELPLYKYHIIIIALIAVVGLLICICLTIRQVMTLKVYTKQFVEKHGNAKKQQLL